MARSLPMWVCMLLVAGCEPECFESNDCAPRAGQRATCERGRCLFVAGHSAPGDDAGPAEEDEDGGTVSDSGAEPSDSGPASVDAGGPPDAALPPDAGLPVDAGVRGDAGVSVDAGGFDAGRPDAGGASPAPLRDGGVFVVTLYVAPLEMPLDDGGGIRGQGVFSFLGDGGGTWLMSYRFSHDAGAQITGAELRDSIAPLDGPVILSGLTPSGSAVVSSAVQQNIQAGRTTLSLADGNRWYLRGQLIIAGEEFSAATLVPLAGKPHPGSGGFQMLTRLTGLTLRYEARWSSDVVATAAHIHHPNGTALVNLALLPDAGGASGLGSLIALSSCQASPCYTDVHTVDGGVGGVLLRTP